MKAKLNRALDSISEAIDALPRRALTDSDAVSYLEDARETIRELLKEPAGLTLTPDEWFLLSDASLYGLHCAGVHNPRTLDYVAKYFASLRRASESDSTASRVLESLSLKMAAAGEGLARSL